ncbi:LytR C-terminal domain-containing protein [Arthrobacter sp. MMS18-M83]|uniref:LytR C-terminal domain-containing protein n=1 Tax=Arthrobacter sp. MMS18-M83 TaxID=2996261 RepID=UPI00227A82DA|nr:LytR C-terminal domain-containing protein [Arthrobacter sp. MMS18-M83]WAH99020.1 LytR C-terminal domain-containing protein [Arthrobacter sp. MMS18-M83]
MTKFARDEFDRVPQSSSRQGVHRLVATASRPALWPVLLLGGIALAVGLVAFLILPKLGFTSSTTPQAAVTANASKQTAAASAPAPSVSTSPSSPAQPSSQPGDTPPSTPTPTTAPLDKTATVAVYNGTTTGGLAARVAAVVQGGGWPLSTVANWGGVPQQSSSVFYKGPAQKSNAEALGKLLGIANLVDSAEFPQPVVVILGPGYK